MKDIIEGRSWYIDTVALPVLKENYDDPFSVTAQYNGETFSAFLDTHADEDAYYKLLVGLKGESKLRAEAVHSFRLLDDDGLVYAMGWSTNDSSFAPLDDFGAPAWGCTIIEYFNPETLEWEML